jgi:hypothetical protein
VDVQIAVDLGLVLRCLGALLWGILWAVTLQFSRLGKFLVQERTWISVVIGVGVDMVIGIGAPWWVIWLVVVFSSLGIIARSLFNEHQGFSPDLNSYKHKWALEDSIDALGAVIGDLEEALASERLEQVSKALGRVHKTQRTLEVARYGQPEKRK